MSEQVTMGDRTSRTSPSDGSAPDQLALALVVDAREDGTRWLVRLLEDAGYAVLLERTAHHARERARAAQPDLIVVAAGLPDGGEFELCAALRGDRRLPSSTPIFLTFSEPASREERLAALHAGVWECIAPPHDPDEIVVKANAYVRAKREADRSRTEGLIDPQTGLYNRQGLARRARELGSEAVRNHRALACVVLALDLDAAGLAAGEGADGVLGRGVHTLQATARRSDVMGRLGPTEFAVLAPGTDASGARRLAERLASSLQVAMGRGTAPGVAPVGVRFGYEAVANLGYAPVEPVELLVRASTALRTGKAEAGGSIRRFDQGSSAAVS
jgi:diguanylate cyclase (GGDEF)-like protein